MSCRYTEKWLEIHHIENSDEKFDGETAYQVIVRKRIILLACGLLISAPFYWPTLFGYVVSIFTLILISGLLMWYAHLRDKYPESNELRQLRKEWQEKRKLMRSIKSINTGYCMDIKRKFESEIVKLHSQYLRELSLNRDFEYRIDIKRKARELHDFAIFCQLPIRKFSVLFP